MPPFLLYIPLDGKNLKDRSIFLETYYKLPPSSMRDWEDPGALPGTLPEMGDGAVLRHPVGNPKNTVLLSTTANFPQLRNQG
jgi:hypothetical protein